MMYLLISLWPDLSPSIILRYKLQSLFGVVLSPVKNRQKGRKEYWGQPVVCATAAKVERP